MSNKIDLYKGIMSNYPTGVTVVTTMGENDQPVGMTVNSFASVSLQPLLILWCIDHRASSYESFRKSDAFAVHILAAEQKELCWAFAGKHEDRFSRAAWQVSEYGLPVIEDVCAVLQCKKVQEVEAGDHTILIGEVIDLEENKKDPLLYFRRNVGKISDFSITS
jgi:flavin reductase (DIM6/NTAB) family NADH-FMN oxidoreductase RutF